MSSSLGLLIKMLEDKSIEVEHLKDELSRSMGGKSITEDINTARNQLRSDIFKLEQQIKEIDNWYNGGSSEEQSKLEQSSSVPLVHMSDLEIDRLRKTFLGKKKCRQKDVVREYLRYVYLCGGNINGLKYAIGVSKYRSLPPLSEMLRKYSIESLEFNEAEVYSIKRSIIVREGLLNIYGNDSIRIDDVHDKNVISIVNNEDLTTERKKGELWLYGYSVGRVAEYFMMKLDTSGRNTSSSKYHFNDGSKLSDYPNMTSNVFRAIRRDMAYGQRLCADDLVTKYGISKVAGIHYENMGKLIDKIADKIIQDDIPLYEYVKSYHLGRPLGRRRKDVPGYLFDAEVREMVQKHYIEHSEKFDLISEPLEKSKVWRKTKTLLDDKHAISRLRDMRFSSNEIEDIVGQRKREKALDIPMSVAEEGIKNAIKGANGDVGKSCLMAYVNGYEQKDIKEYLGISGYPSVKSYINMYADRDFKVNPILRRSLGNYIVYAKDTSAKAIMEKFGTSKVVALHYSNLANIITKRVEEEERND